MTSLKQLLENLKWFDITFLSRYYGLDRGSEITLPISIHGFALPFKKELLLALALVPFLLLALTLPPVDPKLDLWRLPILTALGLLVYALIRKRQVKAHLGIRVDDNANRHIVVSHSGITLPKFLTGRSTAMARDEIAHLQFDWHSYQNSHQIERKRAHGLLIKLKQGQQYRLSGMAYPLRSLLYLAIFFDYPIIMQENPPPRERLGVFALGLGVTVLLLNLFMVVISP
ncbi:hypothetical protein FCL40_03150 [Ferrimonas sediminicola]|uniref:Uncharacterized protein n=1 Tax=Ferrimonas sediminicola TaxID=2569538 RepID=A0A4U1BLM8_9GAMM|nr:hypothetical protein [Ferrimonas sediminicola]TKB51567.1 hypothetical protein FCL40_03150 [Ferrimonas sediminicola]